MAAWCFCCCSIASCTCAFLRYSLEACVDICRCIQRRFNSCGSTICQGRIQCEAASKVSVNSEVDPLYVPSQLVDANVDEAPRMLACNARHALNRLLSFYMRCACWYK